ncbi:flavin reductase family protein [Pseudothauera nasutitermitis]|uniref:Flavin reductase family protein n=1 Tax=Pseudothauera nasutitermitis TaxID=2565930 RepID=A0A4S4B8S9_9RHOO|nr:flavin reductase family protein [Pseudothauera nasutitermitis]THF67393.1 flavin reductase family protein [Pseudothauera nasutitermitis]
MSFRTPVALPKSYLLLNHGPLTLVSSAAGGRKNVMAASWAMPVDFDPPKVAVVIDRNTLTRELVEASGEFVLNIPARHIAREALEAGSRSGREGDKLAALGLGHAPASQVGAPLIEGCLGWLECRVLPEPDNHRKHDLFVAEVVAAWADPRVFDNGRWRFHDDQLRTVHYSAGGHFFATGEGFDIPI